MATRGVAFTATFMAIDSATGRPKTGDSANITPRKCKDGTSAALTSATVTEVDATNLKGVYKVAIDATEADADEIVVGGVSATSGIDIVPTTYQMERLPNAAPGASGGVLLVGTGTGGLSVSGGVAKADIDTIKTQTVTCAGGVTIPAATLASTTNITAGTIATVTNAVTLPTIPTNWITADGIAADAIGSSELAATAADEIADAILARNIEGGSSTGRTVKQALYVLRNKWVSSGGTLTVYGCDDSSNSWTSTLSTTAGGGNVITTSDPA